MFPHSGQARHSEPYNSGTTVLCWPEYPDILGNPAGPNRTQQDPAGVLLPKVRIGPAFPNSSGAPRIPLRSQVIPSFELRGLRHPWFSPDDPNIFFTCHVPDKNVFASMDPGDTQGLTASSCLRLHTGSTVKAWSSYLLQLPFHCGKLHHKGHSCS